MNTELLDGWQAFWKLLASQPSENHCAPVAALRVNTSGETLVRAVYKGEPMAGYQEAGTLVTIGLGNAESATDWALTCRVYSSLDQRPLEAQMSVAQTVCVIDSLVPARFSYPAWVFGPNEATSCWVGEATYEFGRTNPIDL